MTGEEWQKMLLYGAFLNSALFLVGCFTAGLVMHNALAWKCALAATGIIFLAYSGRAAVQALVKPWMLSFLEMLSNLLGIVAGCALLFV